MQIDNTVILILAALVVVLAYLYTNSPQPQTVVRTVSSTPPYYYGYPWYYGMRRGYRYWGHRRHHWH